MDKCTLGMLLGVRFVYASRRSVLLNRSITYANRFNWSGLLRGSVVTGAWTALWMAHI